MCLNAYFYIEKLQKYYGYLSISSMILATASLKIRPRRGSTPNNVGAYRHVIWYGMNVFLRQVHNNVNDITPARLVPVNPTIHPIRNLVID